MAKYSKKIVKRITDLIKKDTYTIAEICSMSGIHPDTYYDWMRTKSEFSEAITRAREEFRKSTLVECEKSLIKLIKGYDYEERKTVYIDSRGPEGVSKPKIKEQTTTKKHVSPSLGAIIHFQTNHDPKNWNNRQYVEVAGKGGKDFFASLTDEELNSRIKELESKLNVKLKTEQ
ncbi:MAG: hypothetical protein CVU12_01395 [Bacteroidetes bacterium HGW-Bacteroidetes-7]|jgi:transposase-like protein|nr:MAG: hypothetical protein CVU12_01395 [Bacteroidetes bacterium HGW-Bacteroidetes-7]